MIEHLAARIAELEQENAELRSAYKASLRIIRDAADSLENAGCPSFAFYLRKETNLAEQWLPSASCGGAGVH
jgi:hypothetical protein